MAISRIFKCSLVMGTVVAASLSLTAIAASNPAVDRQAMMKNVGAATGAAAGMIKGQNSV